MLIMEKDEPVETGSYLLVQAISDRILTLLESKHDKHKKSSRRGQWSSSPEAMDNQANNSQSVETQPLSGATSVNDERISAEENMSNSPFVNYAAIAWHARRKEWIGDQSRKSHVPKEPVLSWNSTYDDLLSTNQPFPEPIPLAEMVDFLVDIWFEEGLFN